MSVSIITVTYNSSHILTDFIETLELSKEEDFELIIVDSGSDDAARSEAIGQAAGARVVRNELNVGYGTGSNIGAADASGEWLVFVNPDVSVTSRQLRDLIGIARLNGVQCIGPRVASMDGQPTRSWGRTITPPWRRRNDGYTESGSLIFAETISGCCMAISADAFRRLGGFDSAFFMFCEEMDLHRRLGDSDGRVAIAREVVVRTPGGASSLGVSDRWRSVERMVGHTRYVFKHFSRVEGFVAIAYNLFKIAFQSKFRSRRPASISFLMV
ncbi:N-acetylglucosaminyl-diphospho-decaprenol L-rhamnosyltransferase [Arthrobacter sp. Hiyo4]|nr:N-acetylglucosaminyl-diphospho-decaprenol L-rhamnosyltransferase [Arthrobacter sp. Hiyo4]